MDDSELAALARAYLDLCWEESGAVARTSKARWALRQAMEAAGHTSFPVPDRQALIVLCKDGRLYSRYLGGFDGA